MGRSVNAHGITRSCQRMRCKVPRLCRGLLVVLLVQASLSLGVLSAAHAQSLVPRINQPSITQNTLQAIERVSGAAPTVTMAPETGVASFLTTKPGYEIPIPAPAFGSAADRAKSFLKEYGAPFGIHTPTDFRIIETPGQTRVPGRGIVGGLDEVGMEHVSLQQLFKGLPVTGGQLTVHLKGSLVTAVHAKTLGTIPELTTTPTIDAAEAQALAQEFMEQKLDVQRADFSAPRLEIFNRGLLEGTVRPTQLVWFIEAKTPERREYIWVHAHSGGVLLHFNQRPHARNRQVYTANNSSALPGTLCRQEGEGPSGDADCDEAYDYAGDTYDYFFNEHGRDSYDGAGAPLISTVRACPAGQPCPYANAFWNGTQMVYGEGFAADDVVAHELTHAVTEHSANLFYFMQSGALNESYSDIFGETVDLTNAGGNDSGGLRWYIGEDIPSIGAFRHMRTPTIFGDPGKVSDSQLVCLTNGLDGDLGGVHSNSGVPNHAYALMVDGGTYNGFTITGIGLSKAGAIQYRALTY